MRSVPRALTRLALGGLAVLVLLPAAASAQEADACAALAQPQSEQGLRATEAAWVKALTDKDATALGCILDPGFYDSGWRGALRDRNQALAVGKRTKFQQRIRIEHMRLLGDTGLVWGINEIHNSAGKTIAQVRFTDVFHYDGHRWVAIAAQETLMPTP